MPLRDPEPRLEPYRPWQGRPLTLAWLLGLYRPPDRRVLEDVILPHYARADLYRRVLFVGTRFYTRRYPRLFPDHTLVTLDCDPRMRHFGAPEHLVARIEQLAQHALPESFDAIIMNGVIGWGLNDPAAVNQALDACHTCLRDRGSLVLGLNELLDTTPRRAQLSALRNFQPLIFEPLGVASRTIATPFAERLHTYSFWRKAAAT